MSNPLVIIGTSGNALDVLDVVDALAESGCRWEVIGFLDDGRARGSEFEGREILGGLGDASRIPAARFVNAIGSDRSHARRADLLAETGLPADRFATLVHPAARVSRRARIGSGSCVGVGVLVGGRVETGCHVWLGAGCVIGHDAVIEDHAIVGPGAVVSGAVRVGASAYIGAGASVRQSLRVGPRSLVGMGAVVTRDVSEGTTVVGNPARLVVRVTPTGGMGVQ
jgi:sugar O-acyltransferase (sialic acid O-acetyltransferase NeuD family)